MQTHESNEIIFDVESGISVEEQKDIIRQIELATQHSGAKDALKRINVSKKGYVFPLLINAAALGVILIGVLTAFLFRNAPVVEKKEQEQKLASAEGKLIQEIRRQSAVRIGEKEIEISNVTDTLGERRAELDGLMFQLETNPNLENQIRPQINTLTAEIAGLEARLTELQQERRQLVVISRSQEAEIFAKRAEDDEARAAMEGLMALNSEEERFVFFERQVDIFYSQIETSVREGKIDSAQKTLSELRTFMDDPAFEDIKAVQSQRNLNFAAAGALTEVMDLVTGDAFVKAEQEWLKEKNERDRTIAAQKAHIGRLEREVAFLQPDVQYAELQKRDGQIRSLTGTVSAHEKTINERDAVITTQESAIAVLQQTQQNLEQQAARRELLIAELRTQIASLSQTLSDRDRTITEYQNEMESQRATIAERDTTINEMRVQNAKDNQTILDRERTIAELRTESANQRQTIAERDRTISQNRTQITIQQQQINERDRNLLEQRTQAENLQQSLAEREQVIEELRTQTSGGHKAVTEREKQIAELRALIAANQQSIAERDGTIATLNTRVSALTQTVTERERTISLLRTQINNQQQTIAERDRSIQLLLGNTGAPPESE
ncbi:MAG: hypothetical protein LBD20_03160 [Spirochaetaceae bacterium]|jgi:chromosome segregation ATPase|nr:hypothetical protein [Spirochaetaceae bacterium]